MFMPVPLCGLQKSLSDSARSQCVVMKNGNCEENASRIKKKEVGFSWVGWRGDSLGKEHNSLFALLH